MNRHPDLKREWASTLVGLGLVIDWAGQVATEVIKTVRDPDRIYRHLPSFDLVHDVAQAQDFLERHGLGTWQGWHKLEAELPADVWRWSEEGLLALGSRGKPVRELQHALNLALEDEDLPQLHADGVYGPATVAAVEAFQGLHQLEKTGVVDLLTLEVLDDQI